MAILSADLANTQAWTSVGREKPEALRRIVGESAATQSLRALVAAVAGNHSTVLLTGESGTGKELIARTIHALSDRADKPFIVVHCASFSHGPLARDTGADARQAGPSGADGLTDLVEAGRGGTIYFDEVADMSLSLQAKLLRHFESEDVDAESNGSGRAGSVRIIAASKHGAPRIGPGALHPKLYYRLCVVELPVPPLRDRIEDLPALADFFNARHAHTYGQSARVIAPEVMEAMCGYAWPGNVQELSNLIERWYALDKKPSFAPPAPLTGTDPDEPEGEAPRSMTPESQRVPTWEEAERDLIIQALKAADGGKAQAARMLRIERHRLYRKIKKYKITAFD